MQVYTIHDLRRLRKIGGRVFLVGSVIAFAGIILGGLTGQAHISLPCVITGLILTMLSHKFELQGRLRLALLTIGEDVYLGLHNRSEKVQLRIVKIRAEDKRGFALREEDVDIVLNPDQSELIKLDFGNPEAKIKLDRVCVVLEGGIAECVSVDEREKHIIVI